MKKAFIILLAVVVLAAACAKEAGEDSCVKAPQITALQEIDGATRSILSVDGEGVGTIYWKPADDIKVFYGTTGVKYTSTNTENSTVAVFETSAVIGATEGASTNNWGLYPYDADATCNGSKVTTTIPSTQYGVPETFDDDIYPTLAHSTNREFQFYNVCGGIKFSLSRADITKITFRGNHYENLAGKVNLTFVDDAPSATIVTGETVITLTPKTGDCFAQGSNYYIITLPVSMSGGFTMTFETATQIGVFNYTTKAVTVSRSKFSKKANIDTYATFTDKLPQAVSFDCIDMGLSVKWCTCNLGASQSNQIGNFYMWGKTTASATNISEPSSSFNESNYPYYAGSSSKVTKYCTLSSYGTVDNKQTLELSDDAAYKALHGGWRMPTKSELQELTDNCTWEYCEQDGVKGYLATSNKAGYTSSSLFFPLTGEYCSSYNYSMSGYYWTSSLSASWSNNSAWAWHIEDINSTYYYSNLTISIPMRHWGCVIRPVFSSSMPISFRDYNTKKRCVELWDTNKDGELSYEEAASVTDFRASFYNQALVSTFDEFVYFTGLAGIRDNSDDEGAFELCSGLEKITLPENLKSIGDYSFSECTSLKKITIPAKVTFIGESAFDNCTSLFVVTCYATTPPKLDDEGGQFYKIKENAILYVPKTALKAYQESDWSDWFDEIQGFEE